MVSFPILRPFGPHRRTPLHVAFTPPVETFCARRFGVDSRGLPLAKKPDGDVSDMEWIRPGSAEDRQKIVARSRRPTSVPSLQYDSCPSHEVVGGLFFDFEPIHSCRDRDARRFNQPDGAMLFQFLKQPISYHQYTGRKRERIGVNDRMQWEDLGGGTVRSSAS